MTYIEFSDKTPLHDVCSALVAAPDRVILIGDKLKALRKRALRCDVILQKRHIETEFLCRAVTRNDMQSVLDALEEIIAEYDDCVFDLTGGDEIYLVATGILFARHPEKHLQLHRVNLRNGTVTDADMDGTTILTGKFPALTVEESVRIYGGDIVYERKEAYGTYEWEPTDEFLDDVALMWQICCEDNRAWNRRITSLGAMEACRGADEDPLSLTADTEIVKEGVEHQHNIFELPHEFLRRLFDNGFLTEYHHDGAVVTLRYKDEQVKRCLTKAGQILELAIFLAACNATEKDGDLTYGDVMTGVVIDWDGELSDGGPESRNEIDVMMMHGCVPVFVSCKNGDVGVAELYKLNAVAEHFGGEYVRKILVAPSLGETGSDAYLRQRASDMDIRVVEGIYDMSDEALCKAVRTWWCT